MQFYCSDDYYYKVFIEQILQLEETSLIEDYLKYLKDIHFDVSPEEPSISTIVLKSDDITELQKILEDKELSKLFAHRFLDSLKEMLLRSGFKKSDLNILMGEYREYLLDAVRNIPVNPENPVKISDSLLLMERQLSGDSFISDRNRALSKMCQRLKENELREDETQPSEFEDKIGNNYSETSHEDENILELLTHNRNINHDYKNTKSDWEYFSSNLLTMLNTNIKNQDLRKSIVSLHTTISSIKLEHASSMKDIKTILVRSLPLFEADKKYRDEQKYLMTNLNHILKDHHSPLLEMKFKNKATSEYTNAVGKKFNTINNYLKNHMDYKNGKRIFNVNDALRLMIYTETSVLFTPMVRNGNMEELNSYLIKDYIEIVENLYKYQGLYEKNDSYSPHRYIRSIVIDDLFGRSKFDAMNLFSTIVERMESTMASVLNNSNYNYAALSTPKLIEKLVAAFNDFIEENEKLNRSVVNVKTTTSTTVPSLSELKSKNREIKVLQDILLAITKKYPYSSLESNKSIIKTFNSQNIFIKRK